MSAKVRCSLPRLSQSTPRTRTLILDVVDDITEDDLFVLMTRVPGVQVGKAYADMDERARQPMKEQLWDWINQLRRLPVLPLLTIHIEFLGDACKVDRITFSGPIGPFSTVSRVLACCSHSEPLLKFSTHQRAKCMSPYGVFVLNYIPRCEVGSKSQSFSHLTSIVK